MNDTAKYLIRATIAADGVVERSDVVGAVFGQTEGLLGDELDLRDLQESSKVGRIDVAIQSENGQSFGEVTVASSLDKVETAILAASLETIDRIGPCEASVEVTSIEDVRAAKRREVVERAKELVASGFEETSLASTDVLEEVRDAARIEGVADYEGLPAGPRVGDSDAVIVVEGRADVSTLLDCGIKNAIAVEGTNVPDAVADLTRERTVTAFLDGDRGGELILRELAQVGEIDYVAFAPPGDSVEDLGRGAVFEALRGKVPYETLADEPNLREAAGGSGQPPVGDDTATPGDGSSLGDGERPDDSVGPDDAEPHERSDHDDRERTGDRDEDAPENGHQAADEGTTAADTAAHDADTAAHAAEGAAGTTSEVVDGAHTDSDGDAVSGATVDADRAVDPDATADVATDDDQDAPAGSEDATADEPTDADAGDDEPGSLVEHVQDVIERERGVARLLDEEFTVVDEVDADAAFEAVERAVNSPHAVVVDGRIEQRLLDVAAQRGVARLYGREAGDFVKQPIGTRVSVVSDVPVEA